MVIPPVFPYPGYVPHLGYVPPLPFKSGRDAEHCDERPML